MEEPKYITVREAAKRAQYSPRHFHRFLKEGDIASIRENKSSVKVETASLNAWLEKRGQRAIDPLQQMKQELQQIKDQLAAQEQVNGDFTLKHAKQDNMNAKILARLAELEAMIRAQHSHRSRSSAPAEPDEPIMLVDFARAHKISIGKLRTLVEHDPSLVTVIPLPFEHQKHQWKIAPAQMASMLAKIQERGIAYTPCGNCPHVEVKHLPLAQ